MDARVPAARAQQRFWFLDSFVTGDTSPYTLTRAYRVDGPVDVTALGAAWDRVVDRHPALRTRLAERDGVVWQEVGAAGESLGRTIPRGCPPVPRPGPLARLSLTQEERGRWRLVFVAHRAVVDDDGADVVLRELARAYAAATGAPAGTAAPPAGVDAAPAWEPARPYADYVACETRYLASPDADRARAWWRRALTPAPDLLDIPGDPGAPGAPSGVVPFQAGPEVAEAVSALADAEGTAPATVVLAAFQTLLGRYRGGGRIGVTVPASVRPDGYGDVVGPCTNPVVVCSDVAVGDTFRQLLTATVQAVTGAWQHRYLPFDEVVPLLGGDRPAGRPPWGGAAFRYPPSEPALPALPGAVVTPAGGTPAGGAPVPEDGNADLTLALRRTSGGVAGMLRYRPRALDAQGARLVARQLGTLLRAAVAAPDTPVGDLPLDSPEQQEAVRHLGDRTGDPPSPDSRVDEQVRASARRRSRAVAVADSAATVCYGALATRADAVTRALREAAPVAGRPVVLRLPSGAWQVAAVLGTMAAGASVVGVPSGAAGERQRALLRALAPACVVFHSGEQGGRGTDAAPLDLGVPAVDLARLRYRTGPIVTPEAPRQGLDDWAYIAATSGSTGEPKGIPQSHATLSQFVRWFAAVADIAPGDRVAQWASPGYDAHLCEAFAALTTGATLCPVPGRARAHPQRMLTWLAEARVTHFQTVPSFARELLHAAEQGNLRLPALRVLLLAGEALPGPLADALRRALPGIRLVNLYGPTETVLATWYPVTGPASATVPVGRPIPGRQVLVLDDADRPCPTGVTGHVVLRTPYLTPGYRGAGAADEAPFTPVGTDVPVARPDARCYRTGDLGRWRADGALEFRGRSDDQLQFYGARTEPADLEQALAAHPTVADCAVVAGGHDDGLVTRLLAYVVPRGAGGTGRKHERSWRQALRARFGAAVPAVSFVVLDHLPRNLGGKVDRRALPDPGAPDPGQRARAPETAAQRRVAHLWRDVIGAVQVGPEDDFFACGGHSLALLTLASRLRAECGVPVRPAALYADRTLAGMATHLEPAAEPARATGAGPALDRRRSDDPTRQSDRPTVCGVNDSGQG